jgi:hypothetical protein
MDIPVTLRAGDFLTICETNSFARQALFNANNLHLNVPAETVHGFLAAMWATPSDFSYVQHGLREHVTAAATRNLMVGHKWSLGCNATFSLPAVSCFSFLSFHIHLYRFLCSFLFTLSLKSSIFLDTMPCGLFRVNRRFGGMSVEFQGNTQRYIPTDIKLHNHGCENFKSCIYFPSFTLSLSSMFPSFDLSFFLHVFLCSFIPNCFFFWFCFNLSSFFFLSLFLCFYIRRDYCRISYSFC